MTRSVALALVVVGMLLLVHGIHASDSIDSSLARVVTGSPTGETIRLLVGGLVAVVAYRRNASGSATELLRCSPHISRSHNRLS